MLTGFVDNLAKVEMTEQGNTIWNRGVKLAAALLTPWGSIIVAIATEAN